MSVRGAAMYFGHKYFCIRETFGNRFHNRAISFGTDGGHMAVDTYVATLDTSASLNRFAADSCVEVEDVSVVLPQTLNFLIRREI